MSKYHHLSAKELCYVDWKSKFACLLAWNVIRTSPPCGTQLHQCIVYIWHVFVNSNRLLGWISDQLTNKYIILNFSCFVNSKIMLHICFVMITRILTYEVVYSDWYTYHTSHGVMTISLSFPPHTKMKMLKISLWDLKEQLNHLFKVWTSA